MFGEKPECKENLYTFEYLLIFLEAFQSTDMCFKSIPIQFKEKKKIETG